MSASSAEPPPLAARRRPRSLALELVDALGERIRGGTYPAGERLPTESALVQDFGVSRTVVREAISRLQAAGIVETRHGVGTFVTGPGDASVFQVRPDQLGTLQEVIAMLELRIAVETEAAALAAVRRTPGELMRMRDALQAFDRAIEAGQDAVLPDFAFHQEVARATHNPRFADLFAALGTGAIPRARLAPQAAAAEAHRAYLRRVNVEHRNLLEAIESGDADAARAAMRTHLANSRERRRRAAVSAVS